MGLPWTGEPVLLPAELRALRPRATQLFDGVQRAAWQVDPPLLGPLRGRAAVLLGHPCAPGRTPPTGRLAELAEQFVLDVSGIDERQRAALRAQLGDRADDVVRALFVVEFAMRLELVSTALLDGRPVQGPATTPAPDLRAALADYSDEVVRGRALDPVLTELVRLRCARTHDCRICQALRLGDAADAGVDEAVTDEIDRYEASDLPERTKVALRVTDAFVSRPDTLAPVLARELLTPEERAELCLDIVKWSTQKVHVALGTDGTERLALDERGLSVFRFGADGRATLATRPGAAR